MQEKIKAELLKELYTNIDKIYDSLEQHFLLSTEHEALIINHLNRLKDQLYTIITHTKLS